MGMGRAAGVALGATLALGLAACTTGGTTSGVKAAPAAASSTCAKALAAAPETVAGLARTPVSVEGALSWGEPAVILRCGLPAQAPTKDRCLTIDGAGKVGKLDWVVDDSGDPIVLVSYGRDPAVELRVPASRRDDAVTAAVDVGPVAAALPTNGRSCIGADDVSAAPSAG
jgi:hypothetical protein